MPLNDSLSWLAGKVSVPRFVVVAVGATLLVFVLRLFWPGGGPDSDQVRALIDRSEYQKAETLLLAGEPDKSDAEWRQLKAAVDCGRSREETCLKELKALAETGDLEGEEPEVADAFGRLLDERVSLADLVLIAKEMDPTARLIVLKDKAGAATGVGRRNALAVLAELGEKEAVDRSAAYAEEFSKARSCKQIKAVAARAAGAKDKEALPALRQLQKRVKDGIFKEMCAGEEVERAIKALEGA